jgi:uncharacterized circularly permuted ATP-grasp superfamily protein/uncharacterized alpha-E superfamily protein
MNDPIASTQAGAHARRGEGLDFFDGYPELRESFDEARLDGGAARPHWDEFVRSMRKLGLPELTRRWQHAQRIVHENGIAYSAFGDPSARSRPWELDPIPLLIPAAEWKEIAAGVIQRAKLFNRLLADLYGAQETLRRGVLPAEVLFRHSGYLRSYWGQNRQGITDGSASRHEYNMYLQFYAADLARAPDGTWWILGDRTEAPSGTGYALENRIVTSRVLPDAIRRCRVARLAPYFLTVRDTLRRMAVRHHDNPRVVLLSQGIGSPNYFEDAYLARYLGYTLAQGDDLAVRNNMVHLKTLGGLLPVDVLWRRPNSSDCDALELNPNGGMGAAGLMQASRDNNVSIANALGSGLVESPVFMAFLPALCQNLLGESLKLPSAATWWCGDPVSLKYVLDNLDGLMIRPAYRRRGQEHAQVQDLLSLSRDALAERIRNHPALYVAQEQVDRSHCPIMNLTADGTALSTPASSSAIAAGFVALRTFAVASDDSYTVMPGGLGRVSKTNEPLVTSLTSGEGSKDVWVLSDEPVQHVSLLSNTTGSVGLRRSGAELPSRVADHIYWLGRNLERADCVARLLRTLLTRMTSETAIDNLEELPVLIRVLAEQGMIEAGYAVAEMRISLPNVEEHLVRFVMDEYHPDSLRNTIAQMFRAAAAVRDRISTDSWRIIHRLDQQFRGDEETLELADLLAMVEELIIELSAVSGMVMESMTRTHQWRFLDLGRRMERALQTASLINIAIGGKSPVPGSVLEAMLEICDSLMTYRSRYLANLQLPAVLDLLLVDETNPRSVAYQLVAVVQHVNDLPRDAMPTEYAREQRLAMKALHAMRMFDVFEIAEAHALGDVMPMSVVLNEVIKLIPELSDAINHRYLVHAGPTHQLSDALRSENEGGGR